jgi:hypothetical protein
VSYDLTEEERKMDELGEGPLLRPSIEQARSFKKFEELRMDRYGKREKHMKQNALIFAEPKEMIQVLDRSIRMKKHKADSLKRIAKQSTTAAQLGESSLRLPGTPSTARLRSKINSEASSREERRRLLQGSSMRGTLRNMALMLQDTA